MSYRLTLRLDAFGARADRLDWIDDLGGLVRWLAEFNAQTLRERPDVPRLYQSGVRYKPERSGDEWKDLVACLADGYADCEDLTAWRLAELAVRDGIDADVEIEFVETNGVVDFHLYIRLPDGTIEDPSAILGMRAPQ